ncbi:hypothetical protein [Methylacidimicrobium cyclopophantes]|nr:hypothetical protein [Methylacidimicrobium cyclopophantes]
MKQKSKSTDRPARRGPIRWLSAASTALCLLAVVRPILAADDFRPSPRPEDISEAEWQKLFFGRPVFILAHIVTSKGVSWYEIHNWDENVEGGAIGGRDIFYVRVENGRADMPWYRRFPEDEYSGKQVPPWTSVGLSLQEATEMEKRIMEKLIQIEGFQEYKEGIQNAYEDLARGIGLDVYYYLLYPETIEAAKELGLVPRNFVPRVSEKPQFTQEEREAYRKALAQHRAELEAKEKALAEERRQTQPSPRPEEISEADWQKLFGGKPVFILAHIVTSKGVSWYNIKEWSTSPPFTIHGPNVFYVRVENGRADMPWYRSFPQDEHSGKRVPSWTSLGLSLQEATEMEKRKMEKVIQIEGSQDYKKVLQECYRDLDRGIGLDVNYYLLYPERIEAAKELGLIPRNFVPRASETPSSPEKREQR